jgi:hypothetical protein
MNSTSEETDAQAAAASFATTQAVNWLQRQYGEELNGRQMRDIAAHLGAIYEPYIKVSLVSSMADDMRPFAPEIADAMDQVAAGAVKDFMEGDRRG